MYQRERLNNIIEILRQNNYVTVKYLVKALSYSTATINRDLVLLEAKGIITRTYGGVELNKSNHIPPELRYHKMHKEKNRIAREAAKHINNGDTIFIDGSTTCQCMSEYIVGKKDITVITNNISLVSFLALHSVKTICLAVLLQMLHTFCRELKQWKPHHDTKQTRCSFPQTHLMIIA